MEKIYNKEQSINFIKNHKLNHFGERIFYKNDIEKIKSHFKTFDVKFYYMRELFANTPNVFYSLSKKQVLDKTKNFEKFGLDVSSKNYINNQVLLGEIYIGLDNSFILAVSTNNKSTHRNFLKPNYFLNTDIFDRKIKYVPYINEMIDYIYKYNLFNYIIEFCIFDRPLGIYKEKVIIYEIRTNY